MSEYLVDATAPPEERFWQFVAAREEARLLRLTGGRSDDAVLRRFKFCNVFRHDDAVSAWLIKNWYRPHEGEPDAWRACLVATRINCPHTLADVAWPVPWRPDHVAEVMIDRRSRGERIINTRAYRTVTYSRDELRDSIAHVVYTALDAPMRHMATPETAHDAVELLMAFTAWGPFLSYQAALNMVDVGLFARPRDFVKTGWGSAAGLMVLEGHSRHHDARACRHSQKDTSGGWRTQPTGDHRQAPEPT